MSKTEKSTAVSTATQFTQQDIPSLLEKVNAQIKELTKSDSKTPEITQQLPGFDSIHKTDSLATIIKAASSIKGKEDAYKAVALEILPESAKIPAFEIVGHSAKEWLDYLKSKAATVYHKKQIEKLKQVKTTLENNLSQEMKLANDLAKISDLLNEE